MKPRDLARQFFADANEVVQIALRKYPTLNQQPGFVLLPPVWIELEFQIEKAIAANDEETIVFRGEALKSQTRTHLWNQIKAYGLKSL